MALHGGKLPIQIHWRLTLVVQPTEPISPLIIITSIAVVIGSHLEIITCSELL